MGAHMLLDSAETFGDQAAHYRSELLVHCYRMLGTIDEAEDAVQDTYGRAWQGRQTFRRSVSVRAWLYRIATNVCLNALELRKRNRVDPGLEVGPCPDNLLAVVAPSESGPEAHYDAHESVSLAFLMVLQVLPPRQRAVLLLRDVLAFRSTEVAALLEMSVPAVNSALQRARSTLRGGYRSPAEPPMVGPAKRADLRNLLERYVQAWEAADVTGLVALLREDAVLRMPPKPKVAGARAIGDFLEQSIFAAGPMRLVETRANGTSAFTAYFQEPTGRLAAFALLVITTVGRQITHIDAFADPWVLARFDVPAEVAP